MNFFFFFLTFLASEETIYGSFLSILVTIGTVSTLIFSLLMLFLRFKQPRNASIDRSNSSSTLPNNNQSQYKGKLILEIFVSTIFN